MSGPRGRELRDRGGKYNGSLVMVEMNFPGARQAEMDDDREKRRRALTPMVQRLNGSIDDESAGPAYSFRSNI